MIPFLVAAGEEDGRWPGAARAPTAVVVGFGPLGEPQCPHVTGAEAR